MAQETTRAPSEKDLTMTHRTRLPDRRLSVTREGVWRTDTSEHRFNVTLGVHPDTGALLEVFYADGQRTGSDLQHAIQDACVLISLLLQHGVAPASIGKSLATAPRWGIDQPATVIGVIAAIVAGETAVMAATKHREDTA